MIVTPARSASSKSQRRLHGCYAHAEALPLYQMIAKNVGPLRARGEFLLATNIDILFSDELMAFLGRRE